MAPLPAPKSTDAAAAASKRALVIKLGAIGDVIMAIPAAALLHAAGYTVDWVASIEVAPILRQYAWLHVIVADEALLLRGAAVPRSRAMLQLWGSLRRRQAEAGVYTLVATLYYDRRYRLLSLPVRAAQHVTLSRTDRRFELLAGRHHTDEYARVLLGWPDQVRPIQLAPVPIPHLPASPLPAPGSRPRIVLAPAGARNALRDDALRRWPVELYVELAALLLQEGYEVVLVGGPQDGWASPCFAALADSAAPGSLIDRIAQDSLLNTLALLDSAMVTITHDTGPLHMAGLTATALIGIFGPTDPHGRLPRRPNTVGLWGGEAFACRPCYDGRSYAPCPENACMTQIHPSVVFAEIRKLVEAGGRGECPASQVKECFQETLVGIATVKE